MKNLFTFLMIGVFFASVTFAGAVEEELPAIEGEEVGIPVQGSELDPLMEEDLDAMPEDYFEPLPYGGLEEERWDDHYAYHRVMDMKAYGSHAHGKEGKHWGGEWKNGEEPLWHKKKRLGKDRSCFGTKLLYKTAFGALLVLFFFGSAFAIRKGWELGGRK